MHARRLSPISNRLGWRSDPAVITTSSLVSAAVQVGGRKVLGLVHEHVVGRARLPLGNETIEVRGGDHRLLVPVSCAADTRISPIDLHRLPYLPAVAAAQTYAPTGTGTRKYCDSSVIRAGKITSEYSACRNCAVRRAGRSVMSTTCCHTLAWVTSSR